MTFWKTNFNMPVPQLFNGSSTCDGGFMAVRYGNIGSTSQGLQGFYPGYEVALADALWRWETYGGECLNGRACTTLNWYRGATCIYGYAGQVCIDIPEYYIQWTEGVTNTGVAGWEIYCNGSYSTKAQATNISGDNVSIGTYTLGLDFGCVPSTSQCSSEIVGNIWVEGNNLNYINANRWEHTIVGCPVGVAFTNGNIWIQDSGLWVNTIHWTGGNGCVYRAPWKICQFASTFSNGAPSNPSPGSSYKGSIWVDDQFGSTHLAYIGCDGKKYLAGAGNYPYTTP